MAKEEGRTYEDGLRNGKIISVEKKLVEHDAHFETIFLRLNSIENKISSISWTGRLLESGIVAAIAAVIAAVIAKLM